MSSLSYLLFCFSCKLTFDWGDFYGNETIQIFDRNFQKEINYDVSSYPMGNVYVKDSYFELITHYNRGGAIYFQTNDADSRLLAEDSQFVNCSSNQKGGAIFKGSYGHCVLNRLCRYGCKTFSPNDDSYGGPFCNVFLYEFSTNKYLNYIFNTHVSLCQDTTRGYSVYLR